MAYYSPMAKITKSDAAPEDLVGVFIGNSSFDFRESAEYTENDPNVIADARTNPYLVVTDDPEPQPEPQVPADEQPAPVAETAPAPATPFAFRQETSN